MLRLVIVSQYREFFEEGSLLSIHDIDFESVIDILHENEGVAVL